jgi:predicted phosphoribosyltransferase
MLFANRAEAGQMLAAQLRNLRDKDPIVLAVPRGGVAVAAEVARALDAPLDVFISRKLAAPGNDELAIGAVASDGTLVLDAALMREMNITQRYIQSEMERQRGEILRRLSLYRGQRPLPQLKGKTVIVVDDGVATGSTTMVTLRALRKQLPGKLILAVPVGPPDVIERLKGEADGVVCLAMPEQFWAVGQFFADWSQLSDLDVTEALNRRRAELEQARQDHHGNQGSGTARSS